mgnify:CR=1 FL=1
MISTSFDERAKGPILSSVQDKTIDPCLLTIPNVGLNPVIPQLDAGDKIEPHVSDPMAKGIIPAATADPDPLDDPPLQNDLFQGFIPGPKALALGC